MRASTKNSKKETQSKTLINEVDSLYSTLGLAQSSDCELNKLKQGSNNKDNSKGELK